MANVTEIPLTPVAQTFNITLNGVDYVLTVHWCAQNDSWILDIADENSIAILSGIPLITGCDLLAQYAYLGFGGQLRVQTDNDTDAIPTIDNLGKQSHLYFVTS